MKSTPQEAAKAASDSVLRESGSTIGFGTIATGGIANYAAKGIPDADLSAYMSPYIGNVLDVQKQRATAARGTRPTRRSSI